MSKNYGAYEGLLLGFDEENGQMVIYEADSGEVVLTINGATETLTERPRISTEDMKRRLTAGKTCLSQIERLDDLICDVFNGYGEEIAYQLMEMGGSLDNLEDTSSVTSDNEEEYELWVNDWNDLNVADSAWYVFVKNVAPEIIEQENVTRDGQTTN